MAMFHVPREENNGDLSVLLHECLMLTSVSSDDILPSQFDLPTLKSNVTDVVDMLPSTLMVAGSVQDQKSTQPMKILFDTGSNISLLNVNCLPAGAKPNSTNNIIRGITAAGSISFDCFVHLRDIILPEFSRTRKIPEWKFFLFDTMCPYDAIVGRDFLSALQIDPCFSTHVKWDHMSIAFKSCAFWSDPYQVSCCLTTMYAVDGNLPVRGVILVVR